jgi:hypothetical protein
MPNVGLQLRTFEQLAVDAVDGGVGADLTRLTWLRSTPKQSRTKSQLRVDRQPCDQPYG